MSAQVCRGCGAETDPANPSPTERCGKCPPKRCEDCGEMDDMFKPCKCWVSLAGMSLPDIKGILALGDLSVTS